MQELSYRQIKMINPNVKISYVKHVHVYLTPNGLLNKVRALLSDYFQNHRFTRRTYKFVDE
jgi:hypothetical protein